MFFLIPVSMTLTVQADKTLKLTRQATRDIDPDIMAQMLLTQFTLNEPTRSLTTAYPITTSTPQTAGMHDTNPEALQLRDNMEVDIKV